jgi:hypothetical protein
MRKFQAYSKADQEQLNQLARDQYNNQYPCDLYGRFPWDTELRGDQHRKYKTISLTKASLGDIAFQVLTRGGNITSYYPTTFDPRSTVYPRIWLTLEQRDDMIANTRYMLNPPPVVHLN